MTTEEQIDALLERQADKVLRFRGSDYHELLFFSSANLLKPLLRDALKCLEYCATAFHSGSKTECRACEAKQTLESIKKRIGGEG